jgi:hypothetical protein
MADQLQHGSSLSQERKDAIANAIADGFVQDHFRFMPNGEYRRRLGEVAQKLGNEITANELHQFFLSKLPSAFTKMFGWDTCGITGSTGSTKSINS